MAARFRSGADPQRHFIAHPGLRKAVATSLARERRDVEAGSRQDGSTANSRHRPRRTRAGVTLTLPATHRRARPPHPLRARRARCDRARRTRPPSRCPSLARCAGRAARSTPRLAISDFRMPLSQRLSSNATTRDAASVFPIDMGRRQRRKSRTEPRSNRPRSPGVSGRRQEGAARWRGSPSLARQRGHGWRDRRPRLYFGRGEGAGSRRGR